MNKIIVQDMEYISGRIGHAKLDGTRVLISGATGLIGKYLVRFLAQYCNCTVLAVVRDLAKAHTLWGDLGDKVISSTERAIPPAKVFLPSRRKLFIPRWREPGGCWNLPGKTR